MTTTTAKRTPWPQRFGKMINLSIKNGANGRYAIATIDCVKFKQVAFAFTPKIVDQLIEAGQGAQIWVKGPVEEVTKTTPEGATYKEDVYKIVYFRNKSADAPEATPSEDEAPAPVAAVPQDLTAIKGIGASIAEALTEAGIINYAQLAAASDEDLESVKAGLAKRASNGDWRALAADLDAQDAKVKDELDSEIPF